MLLAVGVLRLARQFDLARQLLTRRSRRQVSGNEAAALAWHEGKTDEAIRLWNSLPDSVPVLFNRGMAALFSDRPPRLVRSC